MSTYQRLTQEERYQIKALLKAECSQTEIANILGRDRHLEVVNSRTCFPPSWSEPLEVESASVPN